MCSDADGVSSDYGNPAVKACRDFEVYKKADLAEKAFTVEKDSEFKIVAAGIQGEKLCLKVQCGDKHGWVDANSQQLYKGAHWR